ncbi:MAG: hypothetical protein LBV26_05645 [Bacteroidales bacterium]|nr:hypothetical protein [Bacteroidales bacterium]
MELGALFPRSFSGYENFSGFGISGALEVKYNVQNNMNAGLKTDAVFMIIHKDNHAELLNFYFTYDYYFHYGNSRFSPFIGGGLGYYFGQFYQNDYYNAGINRINNPTCFVRGGFEAGKFRLSLAYHLIREKKEGYKRINYDYLSLSAGFYIGGGKWNRKYAGTL